jgi:hypothetical protein
MTSRHYYLGRRPDPATGEPALKGPDWAQASPQRIGRSLRRALALPSGGWYALGATDRLAAAPTQIQIAGRQLVTWRADDGLAVGFDECPHMGASLSAGRVCDGQLVCPWHGLRLGTQKHGAWRPLPVHHDGVLTWVRLDPLFAAEQLSDLPILPARPARALRGVIDLEVACDPSDVIANRLDPWHGAHFHPQAFAALRVTDANTDVLRVRVSYRLVGPLVIEVDATFHCPDPRTIVMTIVDGEGVGSVVETHATPIAPGRTRVIEVTLATSERAGFRYALWFGRAIRPLIERVARGLWVDDALYAERTYAIRTGKLETSIPIALPQLDSTETRTNAALHPANERQVAE